MRPDTSVECATVRRFGPCENCEAFDRQADEWAEYVRDVHRWLDENDLEGPASEITGRGPVTICLARL